jgi:hypothetical protein
MCKRYFLNFLPTHLDIILFSPAADHPPHCLTELIFKRPSAGLSWKAITSNAVFSCYRSRDPQTNIRICFSTAVRFHPVKIVRRVKSTSTVHTPTRASSSSHVDPTVMQLCASASGDHWEQAKSLDRLLDEAACTVLFRERGAGYLRDAFQFGYQLLRLCN